MSPISLDAAGFRETRENDRGHTKINGDHPLSPKCDIKFFNSFSFFRQTKRQRRGNSKIHVDGILSTNFVKKGLNPLHSEEQPNPLMSYFMKQNRGTLSRDEIP